MTKFLEPSFSTLPPPGPEYRDRWDAIFGKKDEPPAPPADTDLTTASTPAPPPLRERMFSHRPEVTRLVAAAEKLSSRWAQRAKSKPEQELLDALEAFKWRRFGPDDE